MTRRVGNRKASAGTDIPLSLPSPAVCMAGRPALRERPRLPSAYARQLRLGAGSCVSVALAVSLGEAIVFFSLPLIFFFPSSLVLHWFREVQIRGFIFRVLNLAMQACGVWA